MTDSGWDPLHRLINDMKHGMAFGPKEISNKLQTALLSSTYLFNLNYKPFKGGSFHADKKELLQHFMATMSEERSFIFQLRHVSSQVCSQILDLNLGSLESKGNFVAHLCSFVAPWLRIQTCSANMLF